MEVGDWHLETNTINSKLVYFVKGYWCSGVALQGDRGPSGTRGLKGDSGDKGPVESRGEVGAHDKKGGMGDTGGVGQQGPIGSQGSTGSSGVQGAKELREVACIQGPLGIQLVDKAIVDRK